MSNHEHGAASVSSHENVVESGAYFLKITDSTVAFFNKKRKYDVRPTIALVDQAYFPAGNGENKKVKNPNVGEYEGFKSSASRYGWPDRNGSAWVCCRKGMDDEQFHWNIEYVDGSHEIFFPLHGVNIQKDNGAIVSEDIFFNLDQSDSADENKNESYVVLVGKDIVMYSSKDEEAFFEWVAKIDCIEKIDGVGSEIYFYVVSNDIFASDFDDIYGLFARYGIDREQLKVFRDSR